MVIRDARIATIACMAVEAHVGADMQTERAPRRIEEAIAVLATRQHGVLSRAQLLDLGVGAGAIKHRAGLGRLRPLHRGVYAVGHRALRREAWWMAAVLAAGPGAALSYRSAAELWSIRSSSRARIDVSISRHRRSTARLELHCVAEMQPDEVTTERGIPVTTPARTLFDLAAVLREDQLEHAFDEAEVRRLTSPVSLDALLERYPKRRGAAAIKRVLDEHRAYGETVTRSRLERRFLSLLDEHGVPRPKVNRGTDHGELDAMWHRQKLIVECDGFAAHGTRKAFEEDRARDRALQAAGWRVVRITWRQLTEDADLVARQLAALLAGPPSPVPPRMGATRPATPGAPPRRRAGARAPRARAERRPRCPSRSPSGPPPRRRRPRRRPGRRAGTSPRGTSDRASAGAGSRCVSREPRRRVASRIASAVSPRRARTFARTLRQSDVGVRRPRRPPAPR